MNTAAIVVMPGRARDPARSAAGGKWSVPSSPRARNRHAVAGVGVPDAAGRLVRLLGAHLPDVPTVLRRGAGRVRRDVPVRPPPRAPAPLLVRVGVLLRR